MSAPRFKSSGVCFIKLLKIIISFRLLFKLSAFKTIFAARGRGKSASLKRLERPANFSCQP